MAAEIPSLNVAIDRLRAVSGNHFAIHVIDAPYRGGYVLEDLIWHEELATVWRTWQEMFAVRSVPQVPYLSDATRTGAVLHPVQSSPPIHENLIDPSAPYSLRLMQSLGISLWQWVFSGSIKQGLSQSQGIAMGQRLPLRVRLDVRDPDLIGVPWEVMQSQPGVPAISLGREVMFSRTTSDVGPLGELRSSQMVNVLVVLGREATIAGDLPDGYGDGQQLRLEQEAEVVRNVLESVSRFAMTAGCFVDTIVQPTPGELVAKLKSGQYNVFFYAGHGQPAPDGGMLWLRSDGAMSGTELAGVLVQCGVRLAVFNACWGALPDSGVGGAIPRSSLAEVLLHHGVPAVLAMRDSITDEEALTFIQTLAQALAERQSIDRAVAIARQNLLTVFKFNQQAWTLPVLYMHPEFDGELVPPLPAGLTQIPMNPTQFGGRSLVSAGLRCVATGQVWYLRGGLMSVGLSDDNDVVLRDAGVSRRHADLFCRGGFGGEETLYFLKDVSRYGTWICDREQWRKINHEELQLIPGMQVKFGGSQNPALEFVQLES